MFSLIQFQWFDFCVCCIYHEGASHVGVSPMFRLPTEAVASIEGGKNETEAFIDAGLLASYALVFQTLLHTIGLNVKVSSREFPG